MTRKAFLKLLAALGVAGTVPLGGCGNGGGSGSADTMVAYRLSRRGERSCAACRGHAANKLFATAAAADQNRAHPGCNCRVKSIRISRTRWGRIFVHRDVWDRRRPDVVREG